MAKNRKLRALKPHRYGNRALGRNDVYTPEHPLHARLLVQGGLASWVEDVLTPEPLETGTVIEKEVSEIDEKPKAPRKRRARKQDLTNGEEAE